MIAALMFAFGVGLAVGAAGGASAWRVPSIAFGCYLACVSIVIMLGLAVAP